MSMWDDVFGKGTFLEFFGCEPVVRPEITKRHHDLIRRALELHPDADPHFNLQPTIDMLETADLYGFTVTRNK